MSALLLLSIVAAPLPEYCHTVHGRYEIFADGDALTITGNRHRLPVVIDALDKQLEARGWQETVAYGKFRICSTRQVAAMALRRQDRVRVTRYSNITFRRR